MAHDVFISHAHKDKQIAHAICEKLESARIKCWIAERDISTGEDWTEATRNAIGSSQVMVMLLSENANATAHIEREMAHAFYTKRVIVPLRLTETLPRRDFLFYLGNARSFDAFGPPAEEHLEALTTAIRSLIQGRSPASVEMSLHRAERAAAVPSFSESWIGALQASHYRTLELLKYTGIAASLVWVVWLFWSIHQRNERDPSLGESQSQASRSGPRPSTDLSPRASEDVSASKPAYTFTRFGLWAPSSGAATPSVQQGTDPLGVAQEPPSPDGTSSPRHGVDSEPKGKGENLQSRTVESTNSVPENRQRTSNRRKGTRKRSLSRGYERRFIARIARRIARLKARLFAD
jgi:hypothetical protein